MPHRKTAGRGTAAGYGPFVVGLSLILLATGLNLYLRGTSEADLELLPRFLVSAYEKSGKLGVTIVIASLGVLAMLWGWFMQAVQVDRSDALPAGGGGEAEPASRPGPPAAGVALDMERYARPSALPPMKSDGRGRVGIGTGVVKSDGRGRPGLGSSGPEPQAPGEVRGSLPVHRPSE